MGWTPRNRRAGDEEQPKAVAPSPAPVRRRRKAVPSETPLVDAAAAASPRVHTDTRPRGGRRPAEQDPRSREVRVRLGKRWAEIVLAVKAGEYTWAEFVDGLDEEELARGQLRAEDGTFAGRPPSLVPREFLLACQREQKRRFEEIFGSEVLGIATEYVKLCRDAQIPAKDRAKMMQYAMERIFGGIPKDIRVAQEQPWEQMVVNVVRSEGQTDTPAHLRQRYAGYAERQGGTAEGDGDEG